ncbi:MAG: electron transfer flavoprotein subunit alpha/FixB family protein [Phycisphaerales bacterium]|nr:electron transfer flavoprotein subunit alpha/FixB family protein [Phycisphaerales bacterium]
MPGDVLVFAEQRSDKLHPAAAQCIAPARELASKLGGQVVAVVVGHGVEQAAAAIEKAGAERIIAISDPALMHYSALRYRTALAAAIQRMQPRVVLLPATFMGRDLAPRTAARIGASLATDVIAISIGDGGAIDVRRPVFNGKAFGTVRLPADRVAMATVRPNTYAAPAGGGGAVRESLAFVAATGDERIEIVDVVKSGGEVKDVTEADIIVSGGRSLKSEENFKIIYDLAKELDGAVGASRAACDAGFQPHSRQVGLTGKTVTPKLYIACGISGAIQHLAGMRGSKVIVAINTDPEAPIFKIADYCVVGDLFKIVPAITQEAHKLRHH